MPQTIKLALLDDYQKVAMRMADWDRLKKRGVEITVFHDPSPRSRMRRRSWRRSRCWACCASVPPFRAP